ncbi:MAG: 16S rRNA (cytosine(1402)-N(4))-methyltransferase RsmH [Gammaproteobacteria bacterium]|nr:16S rRNA (cytosine(1402)-N(4))-methyltransferase RsmH [Gammaproteobacteria bacterium]MBA3731904.1 16S rRNA (cytosine(1402)-N(4))-methyltransferase RsmH [Gammaproteobacteria bacterium]
MHATGESTHQPVLLEEALAALAIRPDGVYLDGTCGRGGHSAAILDQLDDTGRLIGMDKDPQAVQAVRTTFDADRRFSIEQGSFALMRLLTDRLGLTGKVNGILLDLGVSSPQLNDPERGFSFSKSGPLDMRMDATGGLTAARWLAQAGEAEIAEVLKVYGEERFARRIARAIVDARRVTPIETTTQLADLIVAASPTRERHKHPATRSFQAIRIFINRELDELSEALLSSLAVLAAFGRLAVISFHSLEDRIVKRFIRQHAGGAAGPRGLPIAGGQAAGMLRKLGKVIRPSPEECRRNPRSRSAVLRVAERMP